ncbi:MAG: hypothetical protein DDT19_00919 [Syntrophomonadaceae bacterium]|nr:hypothetical protein [Bacillota bacterium]
MPTRAPWLPGQVPWGLLVPEIVACNNLEDANNFAAYFKVKRIFVQISGGFTAGERKYWLYFDNKLGRLQDLARPARPGAAQAN